MGGKKNWQRMTICRYLLSIPEPLPYLALFPPILRELIKLSVGRTPVHPILQRLSQRDLKFKTNVDYTVGSLKRRKR